MSTWSGRAAVGYIRFSKDEQSESLEQQRGVVSRWAQENQVRLVEWFVDDGISGTLRDDRRPDLKRLMEAIVHRQDFDLIACYDLSRFGRFQHTDQYGYYFTIARDRGKTFYFIQDKVGSEDREMGQVILRVLKQIGAGEKSRETARGAIRSQVERARRGCIVGGFPPFGLDHLLVDRKGEPIEIHRLIRLGTAGRGTSTWHILDLQGNVLRVVEGPPPKQKSDEVHLLLGRPDRVQVLQSIFEWSAAQGWGSKKIAGELNRMCVETYTGGKWVYRTILEMLRNPAYSGQSTFNRRTSAKVFAIKNRPDGQGNDHTRVEPKDADRGRTRMNEPREWIVREAAHQALVPRETFEVVQRRLKEAARTRGGRGIPHEGGMLRRPSSPSLLTGMVQCAACGHNLQMKSFSKCTRDPVTGETRRAEYRYYVCGAFLGGGEAACPKFYVRRERIEQPILERIRAALLDSCDEATWLADLKRGLEEQIVLDAAATQRAGMEKRRDGILARIKTITCDISPENVRFFDEALSKLREELAAVEAEILWSGQAMPPPLDVDAALGELAAMTRDIRRNFEATTAQERRSILERFVHRVMVDPRKKMALIEVYKAPLGGCRGVFAEGWYPHGDLNPGPETENLGPAAPADARKPQLGKGEPQIAPPAPCASAPRSAPADPDLARFLALWPDLPEGVRASLLALAEAAQRGKGGG